VLSYLCAGRAIVLSAPTTNLAARIIAGEETGAVVPPGDAGRFAGEVLSLLDDPDRRAACAASARRYAERAFSIGPIADRFETVFRRAQAARS
jgi:glycosyltransferase involved in cell wall biosynthesis